MKEVNLSADDGGVLYLVPDDVAENLEEYCLKNIGIFLTVIFERQYDTYRRKNG